MWILIYCSCCFSCVSYEICYSYCLSWLLVAFVFHGFCSSWYSRCSSCCCFSRFLVVFVFHGISPFWYSRCSCCFFWCLVILVSLMVVVFIGIHGVPLVPDCLVFLLWGLMLFLFLFLTVYVVNLVRNNHQGYSLIKIGNCFLEVPGRWRRGGGCRWRRG